MDLSGYPERMVAEAGRAQTGERIVEAAAQLLATEGRAALTTRRVAEMAGVQAPTIYRLFGDKDGLLEAVAEHVMAQRVGLKTAVFEEAGRVPPLDDLRTSWMAQIEFGLAHPDVFRLLSDPARVAGSRAAQAGRAVLEARVHRVALLGRLRVTERRAADLLQAAAIGVVQCLLATPPDQRDARLADTMFEAVSGRMLTDAPELQDGPVAAAVAFRALVPRIEVLSPAERALLTDWLDRAADAH